MYPQIMASPIRRKRADEAPRLKSAPAGCDTGTFIAEGEGEWIGMVTGLKDHSMNTGRFLVSMFVDNPFRRLGIGVGLFESLSAWAAACDATRLSLWITSTNHPAVALYQRCDFRPDGRS